MRETSPTDRHWPSEAEIEAVIAEFEGDVRRAFAAVLHDLSVLASDYEADVSRGFVRGRVPRCRLRR